ncbi:MAG: hypothetical protein F4X54_01375 [Chloroflexi bacterium]|nr:hypothetical protein [Chloroflexota bacterium]MYB83396.1 hypothetical protein [Chloroflexota bacterium]
MADATAVQTGVTNLIRHCATVEPGEAVLLLNERGALDTELAALLEQAIAEAGGVPYSLWVDSLGRVEELPAPVAGAVLGADKLLMNCNLNRAVLLDHLRANGAAGLVRINNRIRAPEGMTTPHAHFDWRLVMALAHRIEERTAQASTYRVTSPRGTEVTGRVASGSEVADAFFVQDAEMSRSERVFPGEVYAPIGSADGNGVVAFDHPGMADREQFHNPMLLEIRDNTLKGIEWREEPSRENQKDDPTGNTVWTSAQLQHLLDVSEARYGTEAAYALDSFHGGFHPKATKRPGQQSNQDVMHFHIGRTPSPLSAYVSDQTIELDGELFWENGRSTLLQETHIREMAREYGEEI